MSRIQVGIRLHHSPTPLLLKGCEKDLKKYFYIYNFEQTQFFIKHELEVLEIGKGKFGDVYHKFLRDDKANKVFDMWVRRIR